MLHVFLLVNFDAMTFHAFVPYNYLHQYTFHIVAMVKPTFRCKTPPNHKQLELLYSESYSASRDIHGLRITMKNEFRNLLMSLAELRKFKQQLIHLHFAYYPALRQHGLDFYRLQNIANSLDNQLGSFRQQMLKTIDILDCGLIHSVYNEKRLQATIESGWREVSQDFALNSTEVQAEWDSAGQPPSPPEHSSSSGGDDIDGWGDIVPGIDSVFN